MMHLLQDILRFIFDFLIVGVIFKIIIGHWVAKRILSWLTLTNERNAIIWRHYLLRAQGDGHKTAHILDCGQGECAGL